MRVLILSCSAGEGHNSCAKAIQESFDDQGTYCMTEDAIRFISRRVQKFFSSWHSRLYKYFPKIFSKGYSAVEKNPSVFSEKSLTYRLLGRGSKDLFEYTLRNNIDTIICTHVFAALMVTVTRKRHPEWNVRCTLIDTDYTFTPGTEECKMERFFIPDEEFREEYIKSDIPDNLIKTSGIPVRKAFQSCIPKEQARNQLRLPLDCHHLLMMSGSMGCGPLRSLLDLIVSGLMENDYVSIVCGTNRRLYRRLNSMFKDNPQIVIYGYSDNISLLMDSADLIVTKAGGMTTTEAEAKGLPMVLFEAVSANEADNIRYFVRKGCAVCETENHNIARCSLSILHDYSARFRMIAACDPNQALQVIMEQIQKDAAEQDKLNEQYKSFGVYL